MLPLWARGGHTACVSPLNSHCGSPGTALGAQSFLRQHPGTAWGWHGPRQAAALTLWRVRQYKCRMQALLCQLSSIQKNGLWPSNLSVQM